MMDYGNEIPSSSHPFAPFYFVDGPSIAHGAWRAATVHLQADAPLKEAQGMPAFRNPVAASIGIWLEGTMAPLTWTVN
jgi:hypothetical protein